MLAFAMRSLSLNFISVEQVKMSFKSIVEPEVSSGLNITPHSFAEELQKLPTIKLKIISRKLSDRYLKKKSNNYIDVGDEDFKRISTSIPAVG